MRQVFCFCPNVTPADVLLNFVHANEASALVGKISVRTK